MMKTQSTVIPNYQSIEIPETLNVNEKKTFSNKTKCGLLTILLLIIGAVFSRYYIKWSILSNNGAPSLFKFNVEPESTTDEQVGTSPGAKKDNKAVPPPGNCGPARPAPLSTIFLLAAYDFSNQFNLFENTISSLPLIENEELATDFSISKINDNDVDYLRHVTDKNVNGTYFFDIEHEIYFDEKLDSIISKIDNNFHNKFPITLNGLNRKEVRLSKISPDTFCSGALHADNADLDGTVPVGYENVEYTAMIYLSDYNEFIGGELQFISPFMKKTILPTKGNGLLFSSGIEHLHKVNPIVQGDRYAVRILYQNK